jgi:phosphoribosylformylglycinamidine synthase
MLWQIEVYPRLGQPDLDARRVAGDIEAIGLAGIRPAGSARGYLVEGEIDGADCRRIAQELLADPVIEQFRVLAHGSDGRLQPLPDPVPERERLAAAGEPERVPGAASRPAAIAHVLLKPGVMDPVAASTAEAIRGMGIGIDQVRTFRVFHFAATLSAADRSTIATKVLANDAIEQVVWGELRLEHLGIGKPYRFELVRLPIRTMTDAELERLSREGQLSLTLLEMQTIQRHFRELGRDPTDLELETVAQTWSEHCSHKTLKGGVEYEERTAAGEVRRHVQFASLLKETVFAATEQIRRELGPEHDWCVSVFEDNAGVVRFDDEFHVCFKVETHNHPSAIEPYGGANTGVGGVIRDPLGTGLGAKPIANTDVFCFAPPDFPADRLPRGVLHPKRVFRGVVSGVRDYGNRMGIPTVNGAIYFDERYLGNPLVFCGTVGLIRRDRAHKEPRAGDLVVVVGGRTGRDGIHGATFSSIELTAQSEQVSGGAVQIGNAITEKMLLDVVLAARDRGLYHAITDCGAGGFSSAVGEMAESLGAEVWLDRAPLKYAGLSYTEIWISESQERMVLAVPDSHWPEFQQLAAAEGVEATAIGRFTDTGRLLLRYDDHLVGDLDLRFLHQGRPSIVRRAVYTERVPGSGFRAPSETGSVGQGTGIGPDSAAFNGDLHRLLAAWDVCSKEWVIRQYDHEVQGGSVVKPLVGVTNDGPSDAAVVRPVLHSHRGLAIACGARPRYGDLDPYWMAATAIDEAIRNCVAVGADPDRIAILDNFCWGNTDRPEELGTLVRAAEACRDMAIAFRTPFISGKDSLNNEFVVQGGRSAERIVIPPTLLISALGQVPDVRQCVTMDLKSPGNLLFLVGFTRDELGGSQFSAVAGVPGGRVPTVDPAAAREIYRRMHAAIRAGLVRSCHDLSEGGLAVAAGEMCLAGGLGAAIELPLTGPVLPTAAMFSESNSRFLVEIEPAHEAAFLATLQQTAELNLPDTPVRRLGQVTAANELVITGGTGNTRTVYIAERIAALKESWQRPLRW